ncbi:MAG: hypothetical protein GF315_07865 [candidate division Zixibacteria bacterium]|nr:hypothetical protein [candidate division Zixibacteria bacterium]
MPRASVRLCTSQVLGLILAISKNLLSRVLVGIIAIPVIIYISLYGGLPIVVFASMVSLIGSYELSYLLSKSGRFVKYLLPLPVAIVTFLFSYQQFQIGLLVVIITALIMALVAVFSNNVQTLKNSLVNSIFAMIYPGVLLAAIPLLSHFDPDGGKWLVAMFIIIWCADTAAYFGGRATGKRKLASEVSPGKTVEGLWWGFLGALLSAVVICFTFLPPSELTFLLPVSIIISGIGVVGDLFESSLKRAVDVKDSSRIIPGHGGVLDRFDSVLFAAPLLYIFLRLRDLMAGI